MKIYPDWIASSGNFGVVVIAFARGIKDLSSNPALLENKFYGKHSNVDVGMI
jgi:hypothetical protein